MKNQKSRKPSPSCSPKAPLEEYFSPYRERIVGQDWHFQGVEGRQKLVYADWTASGRLYQPIENTLSQKVGPLVANTHTESNVSGSSMTMAYHEARQIIKDHVNAKKEDILISAGSGMTALINKLQRILGLRVPEKYENFGGKTEIILDDQRPPVVFNLERILGLCVPEKYENFGGKTEVIPGDQRPPVVFVSHMEHHSNQTSWQETIADLVVLPPDEKGLVSPAVLEEMLEQYKDRPLKIGSFTACSNVSGIITPYHKLAQVMHKHGGYCIVDFAASAPYVNMNMHPEHLMNGHLDALLFSPHKFLGGPGSSGVLVINKNWYTNSIPDHPGGGTVDWTNPWGGHGYCQSAEVREDGGTPAFLQTMRAAMAIRLKEAMGTDKIQAREEELLGRVLPALRQISGLQIMDDRVPAEKRLGIISFHVKNVHYNSLVHLLNDKFGIQVRGGCSCAGTYGHFLFNIGQEQSKKITDQIDAGDSSEKPGWVRLSLHPTMTNQEADYIVGAIKSCISHYPKWSKNYTYIQDVNDFVHKNDNRDQIHECVQEWFDVTIDEVDSVSSDLKEDAALGKKKLLRGRLIQKLRQK
eukprot:CAMPEP_0172452744 /NCGR_PEP_ID=MMETSP1065-20121228/10312_1 /TAXON_ID=265537 /ORGANISM="Amphiprora paludosa, Strain CCMP125" /LENGTH=582 /DNA_ID=CAMNT_0013204849 /DNA_START=198 /DNA_END=1943 /DNA_ORIENTATION=-